MIVSKNTRKSQVAKAKLIESCITVLLGCKMMSPMRIVLASGETCHQIFHTNHCAVLRESHLDPSDVDFVSLFHPMFRPHLSEGCMVLAYDCTTDKLCLSFLFSLLLYVLQNETIISIIYRFESVYCLYPILLILASAIVDFILWLSFLPNPILTSSNTNLTLTRNFTPFLLFHDKD